MTHELKEPEPVLHYLKTGGGRWEAYCAEHYQQTYRRLSRRTLIDDEVKHFVRGNTTGVSGTSQELRELGIPELTQRLPAP